MGKQGFASMDKDKHRVIASMGGKAAQAAGKSHKFTSEEARVAGTKGGLLLAQNREHMREIGRRGGQACQRKRRQQTQAKVD